MIPGPTPMWQTEKQAMLSTPADLTDVLMAFEKAVKGKVRRVKIQRFSRPAIKLLKLLLLVLCLTLLPV